jgi:hypothetical protein
MLRPRIGAFSGPQRRASHQFEVFPFSNVRKSKFEIMSRPRKATQPVSRFSARLQEFVDAQRKKGACASQLDLSKKMGISPPQLSKLLTSPGPVPATAAAEVCGRVPPLTAFELLREYLHDQAAVVVGIAEGKGLTGFVPSPGFRTVPKITMTFEKPPHRPTSSPTA